MQDNNWIILDFIWNSMKQFIVCTSPFLLEEGLNLIPNFQKGGLDRTLLFREEVAGKEGGDLFEGGKQYLNKKTKIWNI